MSGFVVEVLYVEHCPCVPAALALVQRVCAELGIEARYHLKLWIGFPDESAAYLPA